MAKPIIKLPLAGQMKPHVSFSELNLFNECQWKWWLLKVCEEEIEDRSFHMDFGKAVHAGMEVLYGPSGGDPTAAATLATTMYDETRQTLGELHPSDLAESLRIRELIPNIFRDVLLVPELQGIRPLKSELRLFESIERTDGLNIKFKGFIDIIFIKKLKRKSVIYIADFKTCSWGWPASKLSDVKVISQILLYKHFFCKLLKADPRNVSVAFILLKKKPKEGELCVELSKISAGPKATEHALNYLQSSITGMHSYAYQQNFDACERRWKDKDTGEERSSRCPFLDTEKCGQTSTEKPAGS